MMRRHVLKQIVAVAGAVPFWAAPGGATGTETGGSVAVACAGAGDAALHTALCDSLLVALATRYPGHRFDGAPGAGAALTITLELERATDVTLIARLAWAGQKGDTVQGPVVTHGTRDSKIGPRQYDMLTKALLKVTDLPL